MPENLEQRLSRLIARKRAEARAARERETKRAQTAAHRDAVAASVAEKWAQDQHIISEVAAYFEAKLAEFGVKLAPDFRPGDGHTIIGTGTIKVLGLDGRDRRVTLTVHNQGAVHVSYETPPSKAVLLGHKEFQIATATRATYEAEIFDFLEFAL
jgi:hypothetical protein